MAFKTNPEDQQLYSANDLIRLAKRDNNTKRPYLYVDPLQGKHIPADPNRVMQLYKDLAQQIDQRHPAERFAVIGFAETATAIAAGVALDLAGVAFFQCTTREIYPGRDYLYFTESHSHAQDQIIYTRNWSDSFDNVDRIILVDDEVTTGNTMLKLIDKLRDFLKKDMHCSIASIINSMTEERIQKLGDLGIDCIYLLKIENEYHVGQVLNLEPAASKMIRAGFLAAPATGLQLMAMQCDQRFICGIDDYRQAVGSFCNKVMDRLSLERGGQSILVLGTEEFMYPAIQLGGMISKTNDNGSVRVHATTRSPILVCDAPDYPFTVRYEMCSPYDEARTTYVYNLQKYDLVVVVTDANEDTCRGFATLLDSLRMMGNDNIQLFQWSRET